MLTALILVCSLATVSNLGDCTRDNALDVVYVPATFASPVTCLMHAQAYVADSSIGRDLPQNEGVKVICVRGPINRVDKAAATMIKSSPAAGAGRGTSSTTTTSGAPKRWIRAAFMFEPPLYRVPEIVTRGRFPDGGESDSTWRTQEA